MGSEFDTSSVTAWIVQSGLSGMAAHEIVSGVGRRLRAAGMPLARITLVVDTLHPVHEGHAYRWRSDEQPVEPVFYGRDYDVDAWSRSPFFHLTSQGIRRLRRRLDPSREAEFDTLDRYAREGLTDYLAIVDQFGPAGSVGEMDCVYSSWLTDTAAGFEDAHCEAIDRLTPVLALAVKSDALSGIARTLVQTYLGRDAGERVLGGRIIRGVADRIDAVLWFSDLRGYTRISDVAAPDQLIPLLNDYAAPVVSAIHEEGGDVLKFMGDGLLALFVAADRPRACEAALAAAGRARDGVAAVNAMRRAAGLVTTDLYLALHTGSVFYGNIGGDDRLDFTVVGPAVNEVVRIAAMCRSVDRPILLSSVFAAELDPDRRRFASVGRYALRGVDRPQELFIPDPDAEA